MAAVRKMTRGSSTVSAMVFFLLLSRLAFGARLEVTFPGEWSTTVEGSAQVHVSFSGAYTGALKYEIRQLPAGVANVSEIQVNGNSAVIPVPVNDDRRVQDPRLFEVRILESEHYTLGSWAVHTVVVEDNDARWRGSYQTGGLGVSFEMEILRQGAAVAGTLVTDGCGIIPRNPEGGAWPVTHIEFTAERFVAEIGGVVIPPQGSQLGVPLERAFRFEASKNMKDVVDPSGRIVGHVIEKLTAPGHGYLTRILEGGSFTLEKELAHAVLPDISLTPVKEK